MMGVGKERQAGKVLQVPDMNIVARKNKNKRELFMQKEAASVCLLIQAA